MSKMLLYFILVCSLILMQFLLLLIGLVVVVVVVTADLFFHMLTYLPTVHVFFLMYLNDSSVSYRAF